MTKAKVIRKRDVRLNLKYEPPLAIGEGIHSDTVGMPIKMSMVLATIPPGGRNQRHYHIKTDSGWYVLKGRLKIRFGPDHEMVEIIAEEGDFVFIPQGEIHGFMNLSSTESAQIVASYNSAGTGEEAGTVDIEPVWK
jgi:uncharacterized RmlC-like cupin family protein